MTFPFIISMSSLALYSEVAYFQKQCGILYGEVYTLQGKNKNASLTRASAQVQWRADPQTADLKKDEKEPLHW